MDYGNDETLPLNRIRLLEDRFSTFPRQAMSCVLPGVEVASLYECNDDISSPENKSKQILQWLHSVIAEKPINLIVLNWLGKNKIEVDVYVQVDAALSSESLSTLPASIPPQKFVNFVDSMKQSTFSLLSVMRMFGLAVTPEGDDQQGNSHVKLLVKGKSVVGVGIVLITPQMTHIQLIVKTRLHVQSKFHINYLMKMLHLCHLI